MMIIATLAGTLGLLVGLLVGGVTTFMMINGMLGRLIVRLFDMPTENLHRMAERFR